GRPGHRRQVTSRKLSDAVDALRSAGASAHLSNDQVDDEAATVAAGVCVGCPEAADGWAAVFDLPARRFDGYATRGQVYDGVATPLLKRVMSHPDDAQPYAVALAGLAIEASS